MEQKNDGRGGGGKIKIGVCVMEKKVRVLGEIFEFFVVVDCVSCVGSNARVVAWSTRLSERFSRCFFLFGFFYRSRALPWSRFLRGCTRSVSSRCGSEIGLVLLVLARNFCLRF
jgi:hypothetical protein